MMLQRFLSSVGTALGNQVLPEVWTVQGCHSEQKSGKVHRSVGQSLKQKVS